MMKVPPVIAAFMPSHWAAPCISGALGRNRLPPSSAAFTTASSSASPCRMPIAAPQMSACRHRVPFGIPVVPPV